MDFQTIKLIARHPILVFAALSGKTAVTERLRLIQQKQDSDTQQKYFSLHPDGQFDTSNFTIYVHKKPHPLSAQVVKQGLHEPATTAFFERLVKNDSIVVDVGTNIGWFTLLAASRARKVYAYVV